jgi:hypothetical protein
VKPNRVALRRTNVRSARYGAAVALLALSAACTGSSSGPPPLGPPLSKPALALRVLHSIGPFFYCDPDAFPVGRGTTEFNATAGVGELQRSDPAALRAVADDLGLPARGPYPVRAREAIWDRYKRMHAIELRFQPTSGGYDFSYLPNPGASSASDLPDHPTTIEGFVRTDGEVTTGAPQPAQNQYGCPICLLRNALIATPDGRIPIAALRAGDPVWTADADGHRIVGRVLAQRSLDVGPHHAVVHVTLADGRVLVASPGHPLVDGRVVADLHRGDRYDGSRVAGVRVRYVSGRTYDILPSGLTGQYWADGVLVGSTLAQPR